MLRMLISRAVMIGIILAAMRACTVYEEADKKANYLPVQASIVRAADSCYLMRFLGTSGTEKTLNMSCSLAESRALLPQWRDFHIVNKTPARVAYISPVDKKLHEADFSDAINLATGKPYHAGDKVTVLASKTSPDQIRRQ